jgi:hypothetical protein
MSGKEIAKSAAIGAVSSTGASMAGAAGGKLAGKYSETSSIFSKKPVVQSFTSAEKLSGTIGDATAALVTSKPKNEASDNKDNGTHNEPSPEEQKISPEVQNKLLIREKR